MQMNQQNNEEQKTYGVVVGRFQVPYLHDGHKWLLNHAEVTYDHMIIIVGVSPIKNSIKNPLNFEMRKQMLCDLYPHAIISSLEDKHSDEQWSLCLDNLLCSMISNSNSEIELVGGRDSFIKFYTGKHKTRTIKNSPYQYNGTDIRSNIDIQNSQSFREGVIWAYQQSYPTVYTTVDVAILDKHRNLLLGRKAHQDYYRFVGGFSDPSSRSYREDAIREVMEETTIILDNLQCIGWFPIDDWRYRRENSSIRTSFFMSQINQEYKDIYCKPTDDMSNGELKWFDLDYLEQNSDAIIIDEHKILFNVLIQYVKQREKILYA